MEKKRVRNSLVVMTLMILLVIWVYVTDKNQIENEVTIKETPLGTQRVLETPFGGVILKEGEDASKYAYMMELDKLSKYGYKDEEDLEQSTGYSSKENTIWFSVLYYKQQEDSSYKEVEEDSYQRLGFAFQHVKAYPKEYDGYVYNEEISCSELTNGLAYSKLIKSDGGRYLTDFCYDMELYYDLVE